MNSVGVWLVGGDTPLTSAPGPEQHTAAARVVAAHARDADDLRLLLRVLGVESFNLLVDGPG